MRFGRSEFERALHALGTDALAAFVADLWAAGGWETSVEGAVVVVERADRRRRIRIVAGGRGLAGPRCRIQVFGGPDLAGVDVVVDASGSRRVAAAARVADAEYVPPEALRDRLRYGVPRATGRALSERHLGRSLAASPATGERTSLPGSRRLLIGAVVAVVVVGALAGAAGLPATLFGSTGPPAGASVGDRPATSAGFPSATAGVASAGRTTTATTTATGASFPPGLSTAGVENVSALADAHVAATVYREYALAVRFDGPPAATGFEDFTEARWSARVERLRHFRLDATYRGPSEEGPLWRHVGVYADGETTYRRTTTPNRTRYAAAPSRGTDARAFASLTAAMIERYLDTGASVVRPTETPAGPRVLVVALGTPQRLNGAVEDYRAEALVTSAGRVTMLSVRYTLTVNGTERRVRVHLEYSDFGSTEVEAPDWYGEAKNETGT